MYHYIYRITNIINNCIYVGVRTYRGKNYKDDKYTGSGVLLQLAYKKYGILNFNKEILCFCQSKLLAYSILKILVDKLFISRQDTYNIRLGGMGGRMSDETKKKIANTLRGRSISELTRTKISLANKGRKQKEFSQLTRQRMSNSAKIKIFTELHKKNISDSLKGRTFSELWKHKIAIAHLGKKRYRNIKGE